MLSCRRPGALANTFRLVPEYLTSTHTADTFDYMYMSPQLFRSFLALKLSFLFRSFGLAVFAARLYRCVELADWLRAAADAHPYCRCVIGSAYPLFCLRYEPRSAAPTDASLLYAVNALILDAVNSSGAAFISHSVIRDGYVLLISIGNVHTTRADV